MRYAATWEGLDIGEFADAVLLEGGDLGMVLEAEIVLPACNRR